MWLANCTVAILRGTTVDAFGDEKDSDEFVVSGIPASIREVRSTIMNFDSGRPQHVKLLIGRLPARTDIQIGDRLQDEVTGQRYIVDAVDLQATSPIASTGKRLELRRVT